MEQDIVLIQENMNTSQRSKFHLKFITRQLLTASYLFLAIFTILHIGDIKSSSNIDKLIPIIRDIIWYSSIVFILVYALTKSIKIINLSYGGIYVSLLFTLVVLGISIYIAIDATQTNIDSWKKLIKSSYYFLYLFAAISFWTFVLGIAERKASPRLARYLIFKSLIMLLAGLIELMIILETKIIWINVPSKPFDVHDKIQQFYIISIISMVIASSAISIYLSMRVEPKISGAIKKRASVVSKVVVLLISLSILLILRLFSWEEGAAPYLFVGFASIPVMFALFMSFFRKGEVKSPIIRMVSFSMALAILWIGELAFGYSLTVSVKFTLPVTLVATAIIVLILYFENPLMIRTTGLLISLFARFVFILSIGFWILLIGFEDFLQAELYKTDDITFTSIEIVSMLLVLVPMLLFVTFMIKWFNYQRLIKKNISKVIKMSKKAEVKDATKEARNA